MAQQPTYFAEADHPLEKARFVILGVPTDRTACHRKGAAKGPQAIRHESWNFETYLMEYGVDLKDCPIHDAGDIGRQGQGPKLDETIFKEVSAIVKRGQVPVLLGGEHAITPPAVRATGARCYVHIDAHLDYRREYEDSPQSHACTTWRVASELGHRNVLCVGVRSMSAEEAADLRERPVRVLTAQEALGMDHGRLADQVARWAGERTVYLSLDMDGIDPAYAPAVGTPEPFGLSPLAVLRIIEALAPRMVGFDCNEVFPNLDSGNTAALGARLVRSAIACMWVARTKK